MALNPRSELSLFPSRNYKISNTFLLKQYLYCLIKVYGLFLDWSEKKIGGGVIIDRMCKLNKSVSNPL